MVGQFSKVIDNPTRFLSWNVKGINNSIKRQQVMSHLQQFKVDIAFLQEMHLCNASVASLKQNWVGQVYHQI